MEYNDKQIAQLASEIIGHRGTMKLINNTKIVDSGSHYVGNYLDWNIWVFAVSVGPQKGTKFTKFVYLQKDKEEFGISWNIKLGERFTKRDIRSYCAVYYREAR